jgi:MFS family permease
MAFAGGAALAAAMGIGRFAFTPLLPVMQAEAGVTVTEGGWLAAANYAGYLFGALWAMARPAPPGPTVRKALLVTGITTLAMGATQSFAAWLVLRLAAGIASAWALIHVASWVGTLGRPLLGGVVFAGVGAGIALAGFLCLALMSVGASAAQGWIVLGLLCFAAAALWRVENKPIEKKLVEKPLIWTPDAMRLVLCYGAFGLGYIIPATFVPAMAKEAIADPWVFGWAWPLFGLAAAASTLAAAPFSRRFGHRRVWAAAALVMALGVASPLLFPGFAGIAVAALLVGATFMVITMSGLQAAPRLVAPLTAAFAAGQITGPLLVAASAAFAAPLIAASVLLALSAAALVFNPRRTP